MLLGMGGTAFAIAAVEPPLLPSGTITFLCLAAVLGAGAGAVFAVVARVAPADKVGAVTGVVGAAGGLGGFFPPLVMDALYRVTGGYTAGLALLAGTALACAVLVQTSLRHKTAASDTGISRS